MQHRFSKQPHIVINRKNNRINDASVIKYETNSVKQLYKRQVSLFSSSQFNVDSDQFNNGVDLSIMKQTGFS